MAGQSGRKDWPSVAKFPLDDVLLSLCRFKELLMGYS